MNLVWREAGLWEAEAVFVLKGRPNDVARELPYVMGFRYDDGNSLHLETDHERDPRFHPEVTVRGWRNDGTGNVVPIATTGSAAARFVAGLACRICKRSFLAIRGSVLAETMVCLGCSRKQDVAAEAYAGVLLEIGGPASFLTGSISEGGR